MPSTIRKMAPLIVLAGLALMPREPSARRREWGRPREREALQRAESTPERHETDAHDLHDPSRGRQAETPGEIPRRGWKDILIRTWKEFQEDQVPLVAAGVTFYVLLALFPALGAFVALYGLFADVAEAQRHLQLLSVVLPPDVLDLLGEQMVRISAGHEAGLSLAFLGGLLLSIWSANGAMKALMLAMNIAYDEKERRGFVRKTATSLAFTLGFLAFAVLSIGVIAAAPAVDAFAGAAAGFAFRAATWIGLIAAMGLGLALLYRFGPSRDRVKWRWISWGSAGALALWILGSAAFSIYVSNFANYEKTYGSLGAAIGFLMWVYVSAQVVLLGAELNSEIEHQTVRDTTVGPERPLGVRGAVMADTVGEAQGR